MGSQQQEEFAELELDQPIPQNEPNKSSGRVLTFLIAAVASVFVVASVAAKPWTPGAAQPVPSNLDGKTELRHGSKTAGVETAGAETAVCSGWCPPTGWPQCDKLIDLKDRLHLGLRDENCNTALMGPGAAKGIGGKLQKITDGSSFVFFRGTAAFFYVNLFCKDDLFPALNIHGVSNFWKTVPHVMSNGDTHPENFGLMAMANGGIVWGVNDFDQSFQTPFLLDLMRGATGFQTGCAARCDSLPSNKKLPSPGGQNCDCKTYSAAFTKGYLEVVTDYDSLRVNDLYISGSEATAQVPMVFSLFEKSGSGTEYMNGWFTKSGVDTSTQQFVANSKLQPQPASALKEWQAAVLQYLYHGPIELVQLKASDPLDYFKVLSVAQKAGSGTGSVGLVRYWVLIRGETDGWEDNHILEFKQESDSVLERYEGLHVTMSMEGYRAAQGEQLAYPYANPFFSWAHMDGRSFIVRERSPIKDDVDVAALPLSAAGFGTYAAACGRALAMFHLRASCPDYTCHPMTAPVSVEPELAHLIRSFVAKHGRGHVESQIVAFARDESARTVKAHDELRLEMQENEKLGRAPVSVLSKGPDSHCSA